MKQYFKDLGWVYITITLLALAVAVLQFVIPGGLVLGIVWVVIAVVWFLSAHINARTKQWRRRETDRWEEYRRTGNIDALFTTQQQKRARK